MNKNGSISGLEELHITKRKDGEGFSLQAKVIFNGDPSVIEIPKLQQPNITINKKYMDENNMFGKSFYNPCIGATLNFVAELLPEKNGVYYSATIDPKHYAAKQIEKLEVELNELKKESDERINTVLNKISKLKSSL